MTFEEAWDGLEEGSKVKVSNGNPPPSKNKDGLPYKAWVSNNFTGTLRGKVTHDDWRYLHIEVDPSDTGEQVESLAYDIPEGNGHIFEAI